MIGFLCAEAILFLALGLLSGLFAHPFVYQFYRILRELLHYTLTGCPAD